MRNSTSLSVALCPVPVKNQLSIELMPTVKLPLVNRFYQSCRYSAKAVRHEQVYVVRRATDIVAAVRLTPEANRLFLRSMCVEPDLRGQGVGGFLLEALVPVLDTCFSYCFPFRHLPGFYQQAGFVLSDEASVDASIRDVWQRYRRQGRDIVIMTRPPKP